MGLAGRKQKSRKAGFLGMLTIAMFAASVPGAKADPAGVMQASMVPHRASYTLMLDEASADAGISGAGGRFVSSMRRSTCGVWTSETRTVLDVSFPDRDPMTTDRRTLAEEGDDGTLYRFEAATLIAGVPVEQLSGEAVEVSGALQVRLSGAERPVTPLESGTFFPLGFSEHLMRAARLGQHFVVGTVFDGSAGSSAMRYVSAVISSPEDAPDVMRRLAGLGARAQAWRVSMAFFEPGAADSLPVFKSRFLMLENGVVGDLALDYGRYVIAGTLDEVVTFDIDPCRAH